MEFGAAEISSPGSVDTSPNERLSKEAWGSSEFLERITAPEAIPYEELPKQIELDTDWHNLINDMVSQTAGHGNEVHCNMASIDRVGPLQSMALSKDLYLSSVNLGTEENPLIPSHIRVGTKKKSGSSLFPSAIEWQGKTVPLNRTGKLHTHPDLYPFSQGDFFVFGRRGDVFSAALSKHSNGFLLRTDKSPGESEFAHSTTDILIDEILRRRPLIEKLRPYRPQWKIDPLQVQVEKNRYIAKACNFGLYRGEPNGPLIRQA